MNEQQATPARAPRTSGFTLMEMMIVMVAHRHPRGHRPDDYAATACSARRKRRSRKTSSGCATRSISTYADKNKYPGSLEALVSDKYLRAVPVDPFTASADSWQTTASEPDPGNPSLESGISNVKSGSEQTRTGRQPLRRLVMSMRTDIRRLCNARWASWRSASRGSPPWRATRCR